MRKIVYSVTINNYKPYKDIIPMEKISISCRDMDTYQSQEFIRRYAGSHPTIYIDYKIVNSDDFTFTGDGCFKNPDEAISAIHNIDHNRFDYVFQTHTDLSDKEYEKLIK